MFLSMLSLPKRETPDHICSSPSCNLPAPCMLVWPEFHKHNGENTQAQVLEQKSCWYIMFSSLLIKHEGINVFKQQEMVLYRAAQQKSLLCVWNRADRAASLGWQQKLLVSFTLYPAPWQGGYMLYLGGFSPKAKMDSQVEAVRQVHVTLLLWSEVMTSKSGVRWSTKRPPHEFSLI